MTDARTRTGVGRYASRMTFATSDRRWVSSSSIFASAIRFAVLGADLPLIEMDRPLDERGDRVDDSQRLLVLGCPHRDHMTLLIVDRHDLAEDKRTAAVAEPPPVTAPIQPDRSVPESILDCDDHLVLTESLCDPLMMHKHEPVSSHVFPRAANAAVLCM
jgi:hypothetical protein